MMDQLTTKEDIDLHRMRSLYSSCHRMCLQCDDIFGAKRRFSEPRPNDVNKKKWHYCLAQADESSTISVKYLVLFEATNEK